MGMDMVGNAGPGHQAQVHPDVKTGGIEYLPQYGQASPDYLIMLIQLRVIELLRAVHVAVGGYHQVSGIIRIAVHDDKVMLAPEKYIIIGVIILPGFIAQDTTVRFGLLQVGNAPGGPDMLHH
jgi:hypothetical protein